MPQITHDEMKKVLNAFMTVMDGNSDPYLIQGQTGLPIEECQDISDLYNTISDKEYWSKIYNQKDNNKIEII